MLSLWLCLPKCSQSLLYGYLRAEVLAIVFVRIFAGRSARVPLSDRAGNDLTVHPPQVAMLESSRWRTGATNMLDAQSDTFCWVSVFRSFTLQIRHRVSSFNKKDYQYIKAHLLRWLPAILKTNMIFGFSCLGA